MTKNDPPSPNSAETSSLFSLSSLQEMAEIKAPKPAPNMDAEGSGVLDIRAIAEASRATGHGAPAPAPVAQPSMALPSLLTPLPPALVRPEGPSRGMKIAMAAMGIAIVGLGATTAYLLLQNRNGAQLSAEQAAAVSTTAAVAEAPRAEPSAPLQAPAGAVMAEQPKQEAPASAPASAGQATEASAPAKPSVPQAKPAGVAKAENAAPSPAAQPATPRDSSINDLLDKALGGSSASRKPAPAAASPSASGPATPSRDDVLSAMQKVTPQVQSCASGSGGVALAKIKVAGATGRVTEVNVDSVSDAKVRACIVRAVSRAKLPAFTNPSFSVTYPFKL